MRQKSVAVSFLQTGLGDKYEHCRAFQVGSRLQREYKSLKEGNDRVSVAQLRKSEIKSAGNDKRKTTEIDEKIKQTFKEKQDVSFVDFLKWKTETVICLYVGLRRFLNPIWKLKKIFVWKPGHSRWSNWDLDGVVQTHWRRWWSIDCTGLFLDESEKIGIFKQFAIQFFLRRSSCL